MRCAYSLAVLEVYDGIFNMLAFGEWAGLATVCASVWMLAAYFSEALIAFVGIKNKAPLTFTGCGSDVSSKIYKLAGA
jgi:hypothetical protein